MSKNGFLRGVLTTEFWVTVIVAVILLVARVLKLDLTTETVVGIVTLAVGYDYSRTVVKRVSTDLIRGLVTSEFWLTAGIILLLLLNEILKFGLPQEQIIAFVTLALGWDYKRALDKRPG